MTIAGGNAQIVKLPSGQKPNADIPIANTPIKK